MLVKTCVSICTYIVQHGNMTIFICYSVNITQKKNHLFCVFILIEFKSKEIPTKVVNEIIAF